METHNADTMEERLNDPLRFVVVPLKCWTGTSGNWKGKEEELARSFQENRGPPCRSGRRRKYPPVDPIFTTPRPHQILKAALHLASLNNMFSASRALSFWNRVFHN